MDASLSWPGTILWWICWPIGLALYYLFVAVVTVLKLLYWPIAFVLQPAVYLLRFILACVALPFRALVKLEPLYNYIGVAALLGVIGGLALFYIYSMFHRLLRLDAAPPQPARERTFKQYRQEKAQRKGRTFPSMIPPGNGTINLSNGYSSATSKGGPRNLLDQTIMEEMDSDY